MSLPNYVQKILNDEPVNVSAFRRALPKDIQDSFYNYFDVEPSTAKLSYVRFKDALSKGVLEGFLEKPRDRVDAALKLGDSHKKGVSVGYLLMYRDSSGLFSPDVVMVTDNELETPVVQTKNQVLIIENEENFFRHLEMLSFASDCLNKTLSLENTDVIFSSGNRINKDITLQWIASTYDRVFCAFDYDLGGLTIFKNLKSVVDSAIFLEPKNLISKHSMFTNRPQTDDQLLAAIRLADRLGLSDLADVFHETRRFMEQETLLTKEFNDEY